MSLKIITSLLKGVEIPSRLFKVISWYLLSLMVPADKHSLTFAQKLSGKANSLFSNLLSRHLPISKMVLNRLARRQIASRMKKRKLLVPDCQWTVAIIIDSTLHERSSEKIENSQKFNHGQGWVVGHQWTNIGILINGQYIPLPPIPFFTQDECKRRNIHYRTEHEKIANFLKTLDLNELLGPHQISELVVLADAGYDSKVIQKSLLMRKIDYVFSIKESRVITVKDSKEIKISDYFRDGRRPWKTTRIKSSGGKGCDYLIM